MAIQTSIPGSKRRPGAYHEFRFVESGQLVPLDRRVVVVAEKSAAGSAAVDTPIRIFDELDADAKLGAGSLAALGARRGFLQGKLGGLGAPEIWACPLAEPPAGTAAIYTMTVGGPATAGGDAVLEIAGRLVNVGVTSGDAATAIATAIKAECDRLKTTLPVTASVAGAIVTLTVPTKGVNGNDISRSNVRLPAGVTIAHANPTPGAGAASIATALGALYDQRYHALAHSNHAVADATVILADSALAWSSKNYRFHFIGERGSLGTAQTLQASYNDYRTLITSVEGTPTLPVELAMVTAVAEFAREAPNANLDGEVVAVTAPTAALAYTDPEVESALASGLIPLTPQGAWMKIERLVTTQITVNGAPFEALRDIAYPRTSAYVAEQVDIGWLTGFRQEVDYEDPDGGDTLRARVRDMVVRVHRACERARYLREVDRFLESIIVEAAPSPAGRLLVADPFKVAGPVHQGVFVHTNYLQ